MEKRSTATAAITLEVTHSVWRACRETENAVDQIAAALSPTIAATDEAAIRRSVAAYIHRIAAKHRTSTVERRGPAIRKPVSWRVAFVHGLGDLIDFFPTGQPGPTAKPKGKHRGR